MLGYYNKSAGCAKAQRKFLYFQLPPVHKTPVLKIFIDPAKISMQLFKLFWLLSILEFYLVW